MILNFGDKETEKVFQLLFSRKLPRNIQERAYHKLVAIHEAESLENLRQPPGNRLEALRGDFEGFHSIRINDQWRIVFRWEGKDASEVRITDYH
ncbi:type II toxin-antitoxin system RelE/ParE family toxin [Luteolibacter arcticus]|uniref:Type II toxin-antitoxin system RelE/ParE family toxin n=1 Tax=Luteolibacter arcticus TaxID=1581411 RepID=A0ABT3GFD4_9BACT|nr:type II toxin-antitoxin system RelE/ParE family toxin [Luteolibacter arcticus]MCW1922334.1 type II toxin-antitoxin system RelE/ParE family toxin [Luteolibacter arcticus]